MQPNLYGERKNQYLLESFDGMVKGEYFDKYSRNHRYLILDNGFSLNINNQYYQYKIKVGQHIKKKFKDSIIYIDNVKFNYLKED